MSKTHTQITTKFHKLWELNLKRNQAASLIAEMQTMESHFWWRWNPVTFSFLLPIWTFLSCRESWQYIFYFWTSCTTTKFKI